MLLFPKLLNKKLTLIFISILFKKNFKSFKKFNAKFIYKLTKKLFISYLKNY